MKELLSRAMTEAMHAPGTVREEARSWLTDEPKFTARGCFEAMGIQYDAAIKKLKAKWATADAAREARAAERRAKMH